MLVFLLYLFIYLFFIFYLKNAHKTSFTLHLILILTQFIISVTHIMTVSYKQSYTAKNVNIF